MKKNKTKKEEVKKGANQLKKVLIEVIDIETGEYTEQPGFENLWDDVDEISTELKKEWWIDIKDEDQKKLKTYLKNTTQTKLENIWDFLEENNLDYQTGLIEDYLIISLMEKGYDLRNWYKRFHESSPFYLIVTFDVKSAMYY